MSSYAHFADELLMAVYVRSGRTPQKPCSLRATIAERGLENDSDWLATVTHEFAEKGYWTVEIGDGPSVHLTGGGIRHAEKLLAAKAEGSAVGPNTHIFPATPISKWHFWSRDIDWAKWGSIAAWLALPLTVVGIFVAIWLDRN